VVGKETFTVTATDDQHRWDVAQRRLVADIRTVTDGIRVALEITALNPHLDGLRLKELTKILGSHPTPQGLRDHLLDLASLTDRDISDRRSALRSLLQGSLKEYVEARMTESEFSHT